MGTEAHGILEAFLRGGGPPAEEGVDKSEPFRHAKQAYLWLLKDSSIGLPTHVELGFIYNTNTDKAELGPRRGEPGYEVIPEGCIRGTFDMVWVNGKAGTVIDYKTGKVENAHKDQLHVQAIAASRIWGLSTVATGFLFSRLTKVIPPVFETMMTDRLDLEAGALYQDLKRLPLAEPVTGDWCRWCEIVPESCPAWNNSEGENNGTF